LKTWWGRGIARTAGLALDLATDPLMYAFGPVMEGLGAIEKLGTIGKVIGTTGKLVIDPLGTTWKAAYKGSKMVPYLKDVTLGYEARHAIGEDLRKWFGKSTITEGLTTRETNKILPEFKKTFYDASLKDGKSLGLTGKPLRDYADDNSLKWFIDYMGANVDKPSEGIQQVWQTGKAAFLQSEAESKFEVKLGGTMVSRLKGMATRIENEHDRLGASIVGQTSKLDALLDPSVGPIASSQSSVMTFDEYLKTRKVAFSTQPGGRSPVVKVYRGIAVPASDPSNPIRPLDFVTTDRHLAEVYAGKSGYVYESEVPSSTLFRGPKEGKPKFIYAPEGYDWFDAKGGSNALSGIGGKAEKTYKEFAAESYETYVRQAREKAIRDGVPPSLGWNLARSGELSDRLGVHARPTVLAGAIGEEKGIHEVMQRLMSPYYALRKRITRLEAQRSAFDLEMQEAERRKEGLLDIITKKDISSNPNFQDEVLRNADNEVRKTYYPIGDGISDANRIVKPDSEFNDMVQEEALSQFHRAQDALPYIHHPEWNEVKRGNVMQEVERLHADAVALIKKDIDGINSSLAGHNQKLDVLGKSIEGTLFKRGQIETVIGPSAKVGDTLYTGATHPFAVNKAIDAGVLETDNLGNYSQILTDGTRAPWNYQKNTGFGTSTGRFIDGPESFRIRKLVETGGMRGKDIPDATATLENFRELKKIDAAIRDQRITEGKLRATINQDSRNQSRMARQYDKVIGRQANYEEMRAVAQARLNDIARFSNNDQVLVKAGQTAAKVVRDNLLAKIKAENPNFPMEEVNKLWKEYADYDTVLRAGLVEAGAMTQLTSDKWAGFHVSRIYDIIENPEEAADFFMNYDPVKAGEILSKAANGGKSIRSVNPAAIGKKRLLMTDEERAALLEIKNPFARLLKTRTREGRSIGMNRAFREIFDKYALNKEDAGLQNYLFHANPKDPFKWLVDNGLTQAEADAVMVQNGGRPRWYTQMPSETKGTITKFPWNDSKYLSKPLKVSGPITPENVGTAERVGQGRYGVLSGQWVPQEVHKVLLDRFRALGDSDNLLFKTMSAWKAGMTIDNPAGQVRNHVANLMRILHHTGMEPVEASYRIAMAMKDIKEGGPAFERYLRADPSAHESTMWLGNEFQRLTHEYKPEDGAIGYLKDLGSKFQRGAGGVFQYIEQIGKLATFMKFMDTHGDEYAGKMAADTLFNYQEVPYWVRKARKGWVPFITYPYKAVPAEIHDLVFNTKNYALERHLYEAAAGYKVEDRAKRREEERTMPDYVDPSMALRLPLTDETGKSRYLDTKYIMPLGTVAFDSGGAKTGLDALKQGLGMLNPLLKSLYEIGANKQIYNDQPVTNEMDPKYILKDDLKYLVNQAMPPIAPSVGDFGGRSVRQVRDAFSGTTNMQGDAASKAFTLLGATGFKTIPVDVESNRMKIDAKIKRIESNASTLTNRSYNDYYMGKINENDLSSEVDRIRNYEIAAIEKELAR